MFEGEFADTCASKFCLMSIGGRAEGLACADPGKKTHEPPNDFGFCDSKLNQIAFGLV